MMETWKEMKARHKQERIGMVIDLAAHMTQGKAAETLGISQALLNAFSRKNNITWEIDGRRNR